MNVDYLNIAWSTQWTEDSITWFKALNLQIKNNINKRNQDQIQKAVNKRCSYIGTNQKRFINSLLNREHRSIVLNRVRSFDEDGNEVLYTEEDDVKREAANYFKQQFRQCKHKFNEKMITE